MRTRTRSLLFVLLVMVCSVLESSATSYALPPYCDWTFRVGRREFGFQGYSPAGFNSHSQPIGQTWTEIHYGFDYFAINLPVHVVAAVCVTLPLLVYAGYLMISLCRRFNGRVFQVGAPLLLLTSLLFLWAFTFSMFFKLIGTIHIMEARFQEKIESTQIVLPNRSLPPSQKPTPPVPAWEPEIAVPIDKIIERFRFYTNGDNDFVVLKHGTCVVVSKWLSEEDAKKEALETVSKMFNDRTDMNPASMDDGNILNFYYYPVYTVVLEEVTKKHIDTIRKNHMNALTRGEKLMTSIGTTKFDDFGMKALFGRCYFFMDGKEPEVVSVIRRESGPRK